MMRSLLIVFLALAAPIVAYSTTIEVPKDYTTIQSAIDIAVAGDKILVAPGTYTENIDFKGKAITVSSSDGPSVTIIDGNKSGCVALFTTDESPSSILSGFTLTNGSGNLYAGFYRGGGIFCLNASPVITNNIISNNIADLAGGGIICFSSSPRISNNKITGNTSCNGGGIYCDDSSPTIVNNTISWNKAFKSTQAGAGGGICCSYESCPTIMNNIISGNSATTYYGGGICSDTDSSPSISNNTICWNKSWRGGGIYCENGFSMGIKNNLIIGNRCDGGGGGIHCWNTSPNINNNTIIGNRSWDGGGIYCGKSFAVITNTILWNNSAHNGSELWIGHLSLAAKISYCDLKGGISSVHVDPNSSLTWGAGMIDKDPIFTKGPKGFQYLSQIAAGQPVNSPCLNAGSDQATNLMMNTMWTRTDSLYDSGVVDIGYHYGLIKTPDLQNDNIEISAGAGGSSNFLLLCKSSEANRNYIILGGVGGTDPGIPLPGGLVRLPINWDYFTSLLLTNINTPFFTNFMGKLNSAGSGAAKLNIFNPIDPAAVGLTMTFAYALNNPWNFVSNQVEIYIAP